ncbi:hypothetical protein QF91_003374 [Salmonella enterica subsp. salamae]|uniref:Uncharacterized protein n=1 Tax=Salmonella enterica subsp. salamae TaxID=59202 RepID=A0A5Y3UVR5_SALER|nr:hypothetical protein [Salmonella enterica subsp. salamae]EDH0694510.1 hypothetical protein [Salmonella enterica]ECC1656087.1 hypothetical protein [Salmonella enterica subsp. salamae]ECC1693545.1 hypothetical protein [Salmonella enterica subsp. salamae]ECD9414474.1 hypothetical protein [Salmonella enterica subsp. salamae]
MFYKNGDAFCDVGWDDNLVLNADPATSVPVLPLIQVYYMASRRKVSVNLATPCRSSLLAFFLSL